MLEFWFEDNFPVYIYVYIVFSYLYSLINSFESLIRNWKEILESRNSLSCRTQSKCSKHRSLEGRRSARLWRRILEADIQAIQLSAHFLDYLGAAAVFMSGVMSGVYGVSSVIEKSRPSLPTKGSQNPAGLECTS